MELFIERVSRFSTFNLIVNVLLLSRSYLPSITGGVTSRSAIVCGLPKFIASTHSNTNKIFWN